MWVLPSSSGRAVLTAQEREGPYRALGARLAGVPWPLPDGWRLPDAAPQEAEAAVEAAAGASVEGAREQAEEEGA